VSIKNKQSNKQTKPKNPSYPNCRESLDVMIYASHLYLMTQETENKSVWLQVNVTILKCFSWAIMV